MFSCVLASGAVKQDGHVAAFDVIVIGSGLASRRAPVQAAKLKKSVLMVERRRRPAGVCVLTNNSVENAARDGAEPLRLAGTRLVRPHIEKDDNTAEGVCTSHSDHEVEVLEHQFGAFQLSA